MIDQARRVLASQGKPVAWADDMTLEEIEKLSSLLDETGQLTPDTPQLFNQFLDEYFDRRKSSLDKT